MHPINKILKLKLIFLSLIFPVSFGLLGFIIGIYFHNLAVALILSSLGLIVGLLIDLVCYHRKLFTSALYQGPIPIALFLLFWWISDIFVNDLFAFLIGFGGLFLGLWLNTELIIPYQFYKIKKRFLALIYFFFSIAFLGLFMGIPAFNLLLGVLAGNYLSIRVISNYKEEPEINKTLKQGSAFTSVMLLIIVIIAALIAFSDLDNSILIAQQILFIPVDEHLFKLLLIAGGIIIVVLQYFVTLFTAKNMLQLWKYKRFRRYAKI